MDLKIYFYETRLKICSIIFTQAKTIFCLWKYFQILKNVLKKIVHDSSYLYSYVVKMKKIMHNFLKYIFKVLKIYSKAKNSFKLNEIFFLIDVTLVKRF